jgi:hypothetical protein
VELVLAPALAPEQVQGQALVPVREQALMWGCMPPASQLLAGW